MDRKPVELVRVPREEQYFDREEVLGRDIGSVFPTEAKKAAVEGSALAELLGAGNRKFISETELADIKSRRGLTVEDGTLAPDKPLAEVLREAKEAKEAAFQDQWKQMKQGKNRPLDEDELEFVDSILDAEAAAARRARQEEEAELAAFHAAQRGGAGGIEAAAAGAAAGAIVGLADQQPGVGAAHAAAAKLQPEGRAATGRAQQQLAGKKQPLVAIKPILRPVVRVKSAGEAAAGGGSTGSGAAAAPATKRQRTEGGQVQQAEQQAEQQEGSGSEGESPGLAGLLGVYGSGSDNES